MTFTAGQVFAFVIAVVGLILTVLNIYDKVTNIKKNANAPLEELEARVAALEAYKSIVDNKLLKGDEHFAIQATYNKMFMQIQLAFVDFELAFCQHTNYTNTEDLEKAKRLIQEAMTNSMK